MRYPIFIHGSVSCEDLERALASIGVLVRTDNGRLVADPVPKFIRKEEPHAENVVEMRKRKAKS